MQTCRVLLFVLFFLSGIFIPEVVSAQAYLGKIRSADSLFRQRKYTDAFRLFNEVLTKDNYFTYKMLLQMAYIKEGMNDYASTMYYLNLYYLNNPEQKVLNKISELATKNNLKGYEPNDLEYLMAIYKKNQVWFLLMIFTLFIGFSGYLIYRKIIGKEILYPSIALSFALAIFFFIYNYYGVDWQKGIVKNEKIFLMDAPAAGSELLSTLSKGDCVQILEQEDIWYKVKWKDKIAYLRANNVYVIK
jgi:hypothetical protein